MKARVVDMAETNGFTVNQIESLQALYEGSQFEQFQLF